MQQPAKSAVPSQGRAGLYILLCATLWSTAGLFIKILPWNAFVISGLRSLLASLVILLFMRATGKRLHINRRTFMGGLFITFTILLFVPANKLTTAANAIVLQYTSPIFIILIDAFIFKLRPRRRDIAVVVGTLCAMSLFFVDQLGGGSLLGDLLALISGVGMAAQFVYNSRCLSAEDNFSAIFLGHFTTFLVTVPFLFLYPPQFTWSLFGIIMYLGVFQVGLAYILYGSGIKGCPPLQSMLISNIEPLLSPVFAFIGLRELPTLNAIIGGLLIIGIVTVWSVSNALTARRQAAERTAEMQQISTGTHTD